MIKILYSLDEISTEDLGLTILFLAGCTQRVKPNRVPDESWRKECIRHLEDLGFDGIVIYPEFKEDIKSSDWTFKKQVDWEDKYLQLSKVILFWIPRTKESLGLTSNIEFGEYMKSGKIVVGMPEKTKGGDYIKYKCEKHNILFANSLLVTTIFAITKGIHETNKT